MTIASDEVPRYTRWGDVPAELYTRTQLSKLDPPRKLAKGAPVRGRALYAGNKYADLYDIADTVVKPEPTDAQRAAAAKAAAAQYVCRRCGGGDTGRWEEPIRLGKGRLCYRCSRVTSAHREHLVQRKHARELLDLCRERGAVAIDVDHRAGRVVVIAYTPAAVEPDGQGEMVVDLSWAGPQEQREVPAVIDERLRRWRRKDLEDRRLLGVEVPLPEVVSWEQVRHGLIRLLDPEADWDTVTREAVQTRTHAYELADQNPWLNEWGGLYGEKVRYSRWHPIAGLIPSYRAEVHPACVDFAHAGSVVWERSMPGATGAMLTDAQGLVPLLHRLADGTEPTAGRTPWSMHPPLVDTWEGS